MLKINGKTFMNIQEAVQWLLDNNCIPFQCTENYSANTEIGLGTIVNPSPAKVRIGSLIFFTDSKVSTVVGVTSNSFIVSDQYIDLVNDVVHVSNVAINASGHLVVTLSNGDTIDAGLIKQVSNFSINDSQHLIVNYNDGTTTDLGAIFNGNVVISGTFEQTNANWAVSDNMTKSSYISDITLTNIYNRAEIINNILYLIINVKLKNETANTIGATANRQLLQWDIYDMPTKYASKVFDFLGKSVHDNVQSGVVDFTKITEVSARAMNTTNMVATHKSGFYMSYNNRASENTSVLFLQKEDNFSIEPNEELYITARIAMTLI